MTMRASIIERILAQFKRIHPTEFLSLYQALFCADYVLGKTIDQSQ
jgi:hypothetical protein